MLELDNYLNQRREDILNAVVRYYELRQPHYIDLTLVTEMQVGDCHPLHADSEQLDEHDCWVRNHTWWRRYTAILYLNTNGVDYHGGVLCFPEAGVEITPKAGLLIAFPSGRLYRHTVTPVDLGRRYSMAVWITDNHNYIEHW
jgi:predicted 2-oxoglutarate/Fe(II)-dependent dioxygenase YbiX